MALSALAEKIRASLAGDVFGVGIPVREYKLGWVALERTRENFGALDADMHAAMFDGRNGALRNAGDMCQLVLAEFAPLAHKAHRLAYSEIQLIFDGLVCIHSSVSR